MTLISAQDAPIKIEHLIMAAQFLTENAEERAIQHELLSVIETVVKKVQEEGGHD